MKKNSILKDEIDNWRDSIIHAWKNYFYKEYYNHITASILSDYNKIHTYLSQFEREIPIPMPIDIHDKKVQKIILNIVPLDNENIFNASNRENKWQHIISTPQYVEWENLYSYRSKLTMKEKDDDACGAIKRNIVQTLSMYFPYLEIESFSLQNIMVTDIENGNIHCTITDLGDDIKKFVDDQKEMWVFEKIESGKIKKRRSDKVIVRYKESWELV